MTTTLSIVAPMHNEAEVVEHFFSTIIPILDRVDPRFEIVCVDDGSSDATWEVLLARNARDGRIRALRLSRNFGKEAALTAGIFAAVGEAVIPIDCDLQDPPELIADMVERWRAGAKVVVAVRKDRSSDTALKRLTANLFYRLNNAISDTRIPPNAGDFRLMDRQVIEAFKTIPERTRFNKGLFAWLGFQTEYVYFDRKPRIAGTSKWKYWKLWNFALDGMFSFSTAPLRVWTYLGVLFAVAGLGYAGFIVGRTILFGVDVPGYASLVTIQLTLNGVILLGVGVIGEYLGRIFVEVKQRPLFLVSEATGSPTGARIADDAPADTAET